jgi:hypothetical protein
MRSSHPDLRCGIFASSLVGSDDPELVKMLWTDETGKAQAVTAGHSSRGKAAQAVGTSSAH